MTAHGVRLPYPDRIEPTVGTCSCGWTVVYEWGAHGDAVIEAGAHVEHEEHTEWLDLSEMSGTRLVIPGRSL